MWSLVIFNSVIIISVGVIVCIVVINSIIVVIISFVVKTIIVVTVRIEVIVVIVQVNNSYYKWSYGQKQNCSHFVITLARNG